MAASGNRAITVAVKKPADDGGSRIIGYRAVCTSSNGGVTGSHSGPRSPVRVPSLTAGKTYTCKATASNRIGSGPESNASSPVIAHPTPPAPPTVTSAKATGLRSITVAFTKPTKDGGAPISFYVAACHSSTSGVARSHQANSSPIVVAGLSAAETYTCTAAAGNSIGLGLPSAPSAPVIPRPVAPGKPKITSIKTPGERAVLIGFTPPADNGGAAITNYLAKCTSSDGGAKKSRLAPAHSPVRVNGLTGAKTYSCTLAASNNIRIGLPSAPSKSVVIPIH